MIVESRILTEKDSESMISYVSSDKTMYNLFLRMAEEDKDIILSDYEIDFEKKAIKITFQFAKVINIEGKVTKNE